MFCRTPKRRKEMEIPAFIYNVLPSQKREELITKRNVRIIKEYLKKREQMKIEKENDMARLKQLRKNKSIDDSEYRRLKNVLIYGHEQKRIDLIRASVNKSLKINNSSDSSAEQASKNN
jgi:hypothetical protein